MAYTSNLYSLIINIPKDFCDTYNIDFDSYCFNLLKDKLDISFISGILHDSDLNELGSLKTIHCHFVIVFNKRISKLKLLDLLADVLNFSKEVITIEPINNLNSCVRYLIHKDNPDKFQYFDGNILTNNIERVISILENPNYDFLDYSTVYNLCRTCGNICDIMSVIGLQNYKKYRSCIRDILESLNGYVK